MFSPTITHRFYSELSNLITVEDLPEFLSFAENDLDSLLDSIFYKNFQFSKSRGGDGASYLLDVIIPSGANDGPGKAQSLLVTLKNAVCKEKPVDKTSLKSIVAATYELTLF